MKLFIDTANLQEIEEASKWPFVSGVTTNPSLIAKEGLTQKEVIERIAQMITAKPMTITYADRYPCFTRSGCFAPRF